MKLLEQAGSTLYNAEKALSPDASPAIRTNTRNTAIDIAAAAVALKAALDSTGARRTIEVGAAVDTRTPFATTRGILERVIEQLTGVEADGKALAARDTALKHARSAIATLASLEEYEAANAQLYTLPEATRKTLVTIAAGIRVMTIDRDPNPGSPRGQLYTITGTAGEDAITAKIAENGDLLTFDRKLNDSLKK